MFQFMKTLKFQIGMALVSLIAVFVYFSMHTMSMLEEQRSHGALLRLAGELQVTIQHMAMQAINYQDNAPQDKVSYSRDLKLYYQDLLDNTQQFGSVCRAFASGDFNKQQMPDNLSMKPMLSDATMDAAYALEVYWNDYLKDLKQQLGASDMPKLAQAAEFIVNSNIELSHKTEDLLSALDSDIKHRTEETSNIIRLSFIIAILLSGGIYTWLFWGGWVVLGGLVPMGLIYHPALGKTRGAIIAASSLVVLGGFSAIYVIVIGGQAFPMAMFPGKTIVSSGFFDGVNGAPMVYSPSLPEFLLGLGGVAVVLLLTLMAVRMLCFLPASLSDEVADPHHS